MEENKVTHNSEPTRTADRAFLENAVQQATLLLRAEGSAFYRYDADRRQVHLSATHRLDGAACDESLLLQVCESRQPAVRNRTGGRSALAVPSTWRGTVQGVLAVTDTAARAFGRREAEMLQPLADLIAAALHQTERLTRMTAQFRALHAIDVALTSSLQLDRVLRLILEEAVKLVGAEHGSLRLLDEESGELALKAFVGEGWTPEVQAYTFPLGHGITGWVAQHRQPYLCPDAHRDPQNVILFEEMRSGVAVPLLVGTENAGGEEELLGVLLLESTQPAAFDRYDVELLEALAQEAVIAIQNATRHQALQDEHERRLAAEKWTVMGQAATALAHRINNLIGIVPASAAEIRRSLDRLDIPAAERAWIDANLDRIERNGRFVLKLADGLFRPFQETGPKVRFDVNRLLNEAVQAANLPAEIEIVRDFAPNLPPLESSSLLVDIFLELITNARKALAGRPRQRLTLRTRAENGENGPWLVIEIEDTGAGIEPEQMAHLWDMFKPSATGVGFGLWWVRTFLERQGGMIRCQSRPGEGSTFTVRLPTAQP